jgi:hypothetical protein
MRGFVYAHPRSTKRRVEEQQTRGGGRQRQCLPIAGVWMEGEGRALDARILSSLCRHYCTVHVSLGAVPQARCRDACAALCVFGIAGPAFTSASCLIPKPTPPPVSLRPDAIIVSTSCMVRLLRTMNSSAILRGHCRRFCSPLICV